MLKIHRYVDLHLVLQFDFNDPPVCCSVYTMQGFWDFGGWFFVCLLVGYYNFVVDLK